MYEYNIYLKHLSLEIFFPSIPFTFAVFICMWTYALAEADIHQFPSDTIHSVMNIKLQKWAHYAFLSVCLGNPDLKFPENMNEITSE